MFITSTIIVNYPYETAGAYGTAQHPALRSSEKCWVSATPHPTSLWSLCVTGFHKLDAIQHLEAQVLLISLNRR
ncbi:hypothetical protein ACWBBX_004360, partial [Salmonella enterica subsp. enterica serovar Enteritidis]